MYFKFIVILRILCALTSRTWFVPDETWQSVEIAHKWIFNYGYKTWEWTYAGIRSHLHPGIYVPYFYILSETGLDRYNFLLVYGPKVMTGIISAIGDYYLLKFIRKNRGLFELSSISDFQFLYFFNWFVNYCSGRTLVNTVEMALTNIALYHYTDYYYVIYIVISFWIRPTTAIFWITPVLYQLYDQQQQQRSALFNFVRCHVVWALMTMLSLIIFESWCYEGKLTIIPWNFFKFNFLDNIGSFYGTHPWHWYFSNGFPTFLTISLIPLLHHLYEAPLKYYKFFPTVPIIFSLIVYSSIGHKEHRFILQLIPLLLIYASKSLSTKRYKNLFKISYAILNIFGYLYASLIHQSGPLELTRRLNSEAAAVKYSNYTLLMPCHSTPWQSHVHRSDLNLRYLKCDPPFTGAIDEAELFYQNPTDWMWKNNEGMSNLIFYDVLLEDLQFKNYLLKNGYKKCDGLFHCHFPTDKRIGEKILIYCR